MRTKIKFWRSARRLWTLKAIIWHCWRSSIATNMLWKPKAKPQLLNFAVISTSMRNRWWKPSKSSNNCKNIWYKSRRIDKTRPSSTLSRKHLWSTKTTPTSSSSASSRGFRSTWPWRANHQRTSQRPLTRSVGYIPLACSTSRCRTCSTTRPRTSTTSTPSITSSWIPISSPSKAGPSWYILK